MPLPRENTMGVPILIERVPGVGFRSEVSVPASLQAEGVTEEEVVNKLQQQQQAQLDAGGQLAILQVPKKRKTLMGFAGMFKDDPYFDEVVEIIAERRRQMDAEPD